MFVSRLPVIVRDRTIFVRGSTPERQFVRIIQLATGNIDRQRAKVKSSVTVNASTRRNRLNIFWRDLGPVDEMCPPEPDFAAIFKFCFTDPFAIDESSIAAPQII